MICQFLSSLESFYDHHRYKDNYLSIFVVIQQKHG